MYVQCIGEIMPRVMEKGVKYTEEREIKMNFTMNEK
jgi:hypothetical protein